jgi:hypothetical protein
MDASIKSYGNEKVESLMMNEYGQIAGATLSLLTI